MIIYQKVKMLVYTNKKSGKNFICIREVQDDEGLFITPPNEKGDPRIISLKFDLFF